MSRNKEAVETYIDRLSTSPITPRSCVVPDRRHRDWTVFGAFRLQRKTSRRRDREPGVGPGPPIVTILRMVEQDDVVMAEMTLRPAAGDRRVDAGGHG